MGSAETANAVLALPAFGTLQSDPARAAEMHALGFRLVEFSVQWNQLEPERGRVDESFVAERRGVLEGYKKAGLRVVLADGRHYPPEWVFQTAHSRFVNQYGDSFDTLEPGKRIPNVVFNGAIRDLHTRYFELVFALFGADYFAVRVGGGWYGELNYPPNEFAGRRNCYWGFDDLAQGKAAGLAHGIEPAPVPGWVPGEASPKHEAARSFVEWYLNALGNYHDFQIRAVRRWYTGTIAMLYPSWGLRPGQLEAAVQADLAGTTSPEMHGEVSRGFDFARFVARIDDAKVTPYSTWLDAPAPDDDGSDPTGWSPMHYLASLGRSHPLRLRTWGENTGGGGPSVVKLCFERTQQLDLLGFMWAFEHHLEPGSPTLEEFRTELGRKR